MKKILKLFIIIISLSSCAAKVHLIEDSFYGEKFYQTDYISINDWSSSVRLRLKNISGSDNIIIEAQYVRDSSFNVSKDNKIILKFDGEKYAELNYKSLAPKTDTEVIYGASIYFMDTAYIDRSYSIQAENKIDNLSILKAVRVETTEGFKNYTVPEETANNLLKLYTEMKTLLSK
ncbi:hypothetical protein [uncultured Brachyspira sp.]|uniref:hypothetical protein n=1 Tax=uncultured Brachyspira sp. TaxID=221953 RepID=UPI0025EA0A43|nr:hypothetical protein [uncultured Brachyspira sp.]